MNSRGFVALSIPLLVLACLAQDAPPPSKPAVIGPSLDATTKSIQEDASESNLSQTTLVADSSLPGVHRNAGKRTIGRAFLGGSLMWAQQNVPPNDPPPGPDPALVETLKALDQLAASGGHVDYEKKGKKKPESVHKDFPTQSDPQRCDVNPQGSGSSAPTLFLESVRSVETLGLEATQKVLGSDKNPATGSVYGVAFDGTSYASFLFPTEADATKAADLLRRAAGICRAIPPSLNTNVGPPNLADTLSFVVDRLTSQGAVTSNYLGPGPYSHSYTEVHSLSQITPDPATCQLRYDQIEMDTTLPYGTSRLIKTQSLSHVTISLRRLKDVEIKTQEEWAEGWGETVGYTSRSSRPERAPSRACTLLTRAPLRPS